MFKSKEHHFCVSFKNRGFCFSSLSVLKNNIDLYGI